MNPPRHLWIMSFLIIVMVQDALARSKRYRSEEFENETVAPGEFVFLKVPHLRRRSGLCSVANASMIISYLGGDCSPELIAAMTNQKVISYNGGKQRALVEALSRLGFNWHHNLVPVEEGMVQDIFNIKKQLDKKLPVLLSCGKRSFDHTVVAVGYSGNTIFCLDPLALNKKPYPGALLVTVKELKSLWKKHIYNRSWISVTPAREELLPEGTRIRIRRYEDLPLEKLEELYAQEFKKGEDKDWETIQIIGHYIDRIKVPPQAIGFKPYKGLSLEELQKLLIDSHKSGIKLPAETSRKIALSIKILRYGTPADTLHPAYLLKKDEDKFSVVNRLHDHLIKGENWDRQKTVRHFLFTEKVSFLAVELIREDQSRPLGYVIEFVNEHFVDALNMLKARELMPVIVSDKYLICFHSQPQEKGLITITLYDRKKNLGIKHILPSELPKHVVSRGKKNHPLILFGL